MATKKLIALMDGGDALRATLLDAGSALLREHLAFIQALEDDALPDEAYAETVLAKDLLKATARKLLQAD